MLGLISGSNASVNGLNVSGLTEKLNALQVVSADRPDAVRRLAAEENIPLIDLHQMSKVLYEALGKDASVKAFIHYPANTFPGQNEDLKDNSHFNNFGAYEIARCVIEGIRQNNLTDILQFIRPEISLFNPENPDNPDKFILPLSPYRNIGKK